MGLERLKALFCRRGSGDPLAFSKSEVFDRANSAVQQLRIPFLPIPTTLYSPMQQHRYAALTI